MNKYNVILHTTTSCNFDCSYCDVVKDKKQLEIAKIWIFLDFLKENRSEINLLKFFWWEPLLAFQNVKYIIDNSHDYFWNNYEMVTNTSLLSDEVCSYFEKYFKIIFFSIDSENFFDYEKVFSYIKSYNLSNKVYFNLIISPWKEDFAYEQFEKIYKSWFKNFNILPVYFTKTWTKDNLSNLSIVMKKILDKVVSDNQMNLFWFQDNSWYNSSLTYEAIFIDVDFKVYFSDFVSTYLWKLIKNDLYIWELKSLKLNDDFHNLILDKISKLNIYEKNLTSKIKWQIDLHKIMDYFSKYLNIKKWILRD